jgi:hypothetical protein
MVASGFIRIWSAYGSSRLQLAADGTESDRGGIWHRTAVADGPALALVAQEALELYPCASDSAEVLEQASESEVIAA